MATLKSARYVIMAASKHGGWSHVNVHYKYAAPRPYPCLAPTLMTPTHQQLGGVRSGGGEGGELRRRWGAGGGGSSAWRRMGLSTPRGSVNTC
jgi:hypothetical protein